MDKYKIPKGVLVMFVIFSLIFLGFWIAGKIEQKLNKRSDNITGIA